MSRFRDLAFSERVLVYDKDLIGYEAKKKMEGRTQADPKESSAFD